MSEVLPQVNRKAAISFVKMQGVGNDFVVVGEDALKGISSESLAIAVCERQFGIGADGLLIVGAPMDTRAAYSFAMRNPDGTPDMCGNGMRCAALYAYRQGIAPGYGEFLVETQDGLLACEILSVDSPLLSAQVKVQMAIPSLLAREIPYLGSDQNQPVIECALNGLGEQLTVTAVNTGSTHTVAFRSALPEDEEFFSISQTVEYLPDYPERTSLIWTRQDSPTQFEVRIWERGAGETLGCGTGACAAGVAAILTGRARHEDPLLIKSRGGVVEVKWPTRESAVTLTGPAVWVFSGETNITLDRSADI